MGKLDTAVATSPFTHVERDQLHQILISLKAKRFRTLSRPRFPPADTFVFTCTEKRTSSLTLLAITNSSFQVMVERARLKARRVPKDQQERPDQPDPKAQLGRRVPKDQQERLVPKGLQGRPDHEDPQERTGQLALKEPQDQPQLCCL